MPEGIGDSSLYGRMRVFLGGRRSSADSAPAAVRANDGDGDEGEAGPGEVPGRSGCVRERGGACREVLGRCPFELPKASCVPEFKRMCGGSSPRGDSGDDIVSECIG